IYLPPEFSEDLLSFIKGDIKKPAINYYFNGKINAIAPKITEKGATSVQEEISRQFIETTSGTLLEVFNAIGYTLEDNLGSFNKSDAKFETKIGKSQSNGRLFARG